MNTQIAMRAFEIQDYIRGTESGGIDPIRKITNVTEEADIVDIEYTYPATCGLSDVRYHVTDHGKIFHETYRIDDNRIYRMDDGKWNPKIFRIFWEMPEITAKIEDFYRIYGLKKPA